MSYNLLTPYYEFLKKYKFQDKPILLGGDRKFYNIRNCGYDLDIMISKRDKERLLEEGYTLNLLAVKQRKTSTPLLVIY